MEKKKLKKTSNKNKYLALMILSIIIIVSFIIYIVLDNSGVQLPYQGNNNEVPDEMNISSTLTYSNEIHNLGTTEFILNLTNNDDRDLEIGVGPIYLDIYILDLSDNLVYSWPTNPTNATSNNWLLSEYSLELVGPIDMQEAATLMTDDQYKIYGICKLYDHSNNIQTFETPKYVFDVY